MMTTVGCVFVTFPLCEMRRIVGPNVRYATAVVETDMYTLL